MRVLWFSPTPSLYTEKVWGHNGGGWISALEQIVRNNKTIKLGVTFEHTTTKKEVIENIVYYPISVNVTFRDRIDRARLIEKKLSLAETVINDFKPDIIQLFGSESWYGLLAERTDIPIVIHVQGSLPPSYNARYPVGISVWDKILSSKTTLKQKVMALRIDSTFKCNAMMEEKILRINSNFMGRTHWDKAIVKLYNPNAQYFLCNEALRDVFTDNTQKWQYNGERTIKLISTISGPLYKGMDVILKTAKLLKENTKIDFEWEVCGVGSSSFIESKYGIKAKDVNVIYRGIISADELIQKLIHNSFYIHPSYIDNSPNSVCEAQLIGIPIIATNVGGVSSLVKDGDTGFLVPANDPIMIASIIINEYNNRSLLETISFNEIDAAIKRHNPKTIGHDIISIYKKIINEQSH